MSRFLWTEKQNIGPKPRVGHSMAYDEVRKCVVLFGGDSVSAAGLFNDTWEWDGENWTQVSDIGPLGRQRSAMVFDSNRKCIVLFGGQGGGTKPFADTWEWDGQDWSQVADTGPSMRESHAMVFDVSRKCTVLFGGLIYVENAGVFTPKFANDTWQWNGADWTQQEDIGPPARSGHAMAYDSIRNHTVLFGGEGNDFSVRLKDTWEWDGTAWKQLANFGPDSCSYPAMAFTGNQVALYGGIFNKREATETTHVFGDTWEWDGKHWTERQDIGPGPRFQHAMAFDSSRQKVILFGGRSSQELGDISSQIHGDTWEDAE